LEYYDNNACFAARNLVQLKRRKQGKIVSQNDRYDPRQGGDPTMSIIKVSGTSRTSAVAGAIAGVFRENKRAEVQAIGAIAVNQAIKALALAKGYLKEDGYDIIFIPEFVDVEIDDKVRTAIKFVVEAR
jgi:stage V sporulation protein S